MYGGGGFLYPCPVLSCVGGRRGSDAFFIFFNSSSHPHLWEHHDGCCHTPGPVNVYMFVVSSWTGCAVLMKIQLFIQPFKLLTIVCWSLVLPPFLQTELIRVCRLPHLLFRSVDKCSMGLKSGCCDDHSRTLTLCP